MRASVLCTQCVLDHRRVPTSDDAQRLDVMFGIDKRDKPKLMVDSSSAFIHLAGPIGVYYIHATDMFAEYKQAFGDLIWCLYNFVVVS